MSNGGQLTTAVVTGGAGFIGSHIVEELVKLGWKVKIIDNLSSGSMDNIQPFLKANDIEFVQGSITDLPLLQKHFSGVNYVFHEAALVSVQGSIEDPFLSHENNLSGTLNVLIAARDNGIEKVVFASSSAVYGDTPAILKKEDALPSPQSPYAVNKLAAEYYCRVFSEVYKLRTVCLRYFNVYGPRQRPDSEYAAVIPKFIQRVREGKSPIIYGDGKQTRDFVFVKDVVAANILAAKSEVTGVINVGTSESTSLNQLAKLILKRMNRPDLEPKFGKERAGDIKGSLADISAAMEIGYSPQYTIKKGLDILTKDQQLDTVSPDQAIPIENDEII
jgi:nucleoside-diphosphate-sugar epimerase